MSAMDYFKAVLLTQLFYGVAITLILYGIEGTTLAPQIQVFTDVGGSIGLTNVTEEVQNSLHRETQFSVVDLGALALFSGNILLDLLVNFAFALPQMVTLLINGITSLIGIDAQITVIVQGFATAVIMIMYFIALLSLLTNIRSRGTVV